MATSLMQSLPPSHDKVTGLIPTPAPHSTTLVTDTGANAQSDKMVSESTKSYKRRKTIRAPGGTGLVERATSEGVDEAATVFE